MKIISMTQHEKIVKLCIDGGWHCQIQFWNLFIRSPHKRRGELKKIGYEFLDRKCEHGVKNGKDYKMIQSAAAEKIKGILEIPIFKEKPKVERGLF